MQQKTKLYSIVSCQRGNVAVLFALLLIPLCAVGALAIDYGRAISVRSQLQHAADAAALSALTSSGPNEKSKGKGKGKGKKNNNALKERAQAFFDSNKNRLYNVKISKVTKTPTDDGVIVNVEASLPTTLAAVIGINEIKLDVTSEAKASTSDIEIALVLDNTGSMRNVMGDLRTAAKDLVNVVFDNSGPSSGLKVAIVPYAATVNIGNGATQMNWMDIAGLARHHALSLEWRRIGYEPGCTTPGGAPPNPNPGKGRRGSVFELLPQFAHGLIQLFGIPSAKAAVAGDVPAPFTLDGSCHVGNPSKINHFDLFDQIPNTSWKGCVMARAEPYDVTDTVPSPGDPDTLFVPWFWPDEIDNSALAANGNTWTTVNDYLPDRLDLRDAFPDANGNVPGKFTDPWIGFGMHTILKYNGTAARIDETGPDTLGPNKGCSDEIQPLTADKKAVIDTIDGLSHWDSGGTNIAVGMAWGWRVLSPQEPFSEGVAYGDTRKVIVLMTDGQNNINWAPELLNLSEFSAYGYLHEWNQTLIKPTTYEGFKEHADKRLGLICANAKAEDITVYTISFNVSDQSTLDLMSACATQKTYAYTANTSEDLVASFQDIASSLSELRLAQ